MRLIDADALDKVLEDGPELYFSDVIIVSGAIDAAPTIECAGCEHFRDSEGLAATRCVFHAWEMEPCWLCGDFKRREP